MEEFRAELQKASGISAATPHPDAIATMRHDPISRLSTLPRDIVDMIAHRITIQFTPGRFRRWERRAAALADLPINFPGLVLDGNTQIKYYAYRRVMIATDHCVYFYHKVASKYALVAQYPFGPEIDIVLYTGCKQFILLTVHCRAFHVNITGVTPRSNCDGFSVSYWLRLLPCGAMLNLDTMTLCGCRINIDVPTHGYVVDDYGVLVPHNLSQAALQLSWATCECHMTLG